MAYQSLPPPPPPPPAYATIGAGGRHLPPPPRPRHLPPPPPPPPRNATPTIHVAPGTYDEHNPPHVDYAPSPHAPQHNPYALPPAGQSSGTRADLLARPPLSSSSSTNSIPTHPVLSRRMTPTTPRRLPPPYQPGQGDPSADISLADFSISGQEPWVDDNAPDEFIRDPHKLIAYLVPLPPPARLYADEQPPPLRFLTYTPPPPPLVKAPDEDSNKAQKAMHKVQYKWQQELREAHETDAKVTSWKGFKGRLNKAIDWGMSKTTSADLDFVTRIPTDGEKVHQKKPGQSGAATPATPATPGGAHTPAGVDPDLAPTPDDHHVFADDGVHESETTRATVKLDELVLIYPMTMDMTEKEIREEFVNSLMRTKSKAQRDAVIATGLLPVSVAVDTLLMFVGWVFGGLFEVDAVWAANSLRGAKTARSVTKRLASSTKSGSVHNSDEHIQLRFIASQRAQPLQDYLLGQCLRKDVGMFARPRGVVIPTSNDVLRSIGWHNSGVYEETNWEDEAWERHQVEADLDKTFQKSASAWDKWLKLYERNPQRALKR
ncbi:hypothetical protein Q8F55_005565 [Vanrija albida]|uniref:ASX DEUBAD domain-containing protein n=1 Tax=Vanrija albida TaxID=181172 RepID=A0ABR3Q2J6_9TREE